MVPTPVFLCVRLQQEYIRSIYYDPLLKLRLNRRDFTVLRNAVKRHKTGEWGVFYRGETSIEKPPIE